MPVIDRARRRRACALLSVSALALGAAPAFAQASSAALPSPADAAMAGQSDAGHAAAPRPDQASAAEAAGRASPAAQDIVVTGQRAAIASAIGIKRNATQIVDSITADDIGKLPDRSVTETLQRVTGVTIDHFISRSDPDHFSVEGSGVNIRGLTFVRSELNGRDAFSANGGRTLSFQDIPPELLAAVDVYKNPSADLIEGGIGGLVNLRTRLPFDNKGQVISVSGSGSWGDLRKKWEPSVSGLYSNRWETPIGEIGVLADVAFSRSSTRTDGVQVEAYYPRTDLVPGKTVYVPKGVDWRQLDFTRRRFGAYGALQWKPADTLEVTTTFFQSRYKFHWDEHAIFAQTNAYNIQPAAGTQFAYDDRGVFVSGTETDPLTIAGGGMPFNNDVRSADQRSNTTDISGSIKWHPTERLTLRADLQHVHATASNFDSTVATGINLPSQTLDLTHGVPRLSVDEAFLSNPNNYYWAFTMDQLGRNKANEWAYRADLSYDFDNGGILKSFRFGGRGTDTKANNQASPYNWQPVSQTWQVGSTIPRLAYLSEFPLASQAFNFGSNYYHGGANVPSQLIFPATSQATGYPDTYTALHALTTQLCQEINPASACPNFALAAFGDAQRNLQKEHSYALYGLLNFDFDTAGLPLSGNIGLRWVRTTTAATGFIVQPAPIAGAPPGGPQFTGDTQSLVAKNNYNFWLPSLNLLYKFTPRLQARFAAARAMTRPDFNQLQAYTQLSAAFDQTTGTYNFNSTASSNPYLKPTSSTQLDGALEWYFGKASSLTGTVFYKHLKNIIRNVATPYEFAGVTYNLTQPENVGTANVKGLELAYNQAFTFLPGWLNGFGITSNFTFVSSTTKTNLASLQSNSAAFVSANGVDTNGAIFGRLPLEGLSKYSYNVAGYYEKGLLSVRLAYNWRSRYLLATNINGTQGSDGSPLTPGGVQCGASAADHCVVWGLPTFNAAYGQLDGSIFLKFFNDKLSVGVEAQNLNNATNRVLMKQSVGYLGRAWFASDRRYTGSVRVTF
ncbi:TonB-dependent receptor [Sphingomonas morindae]|uniref:TonB-dependent receptor n=1 Tax=Sphingomonas morindae TaxID=1541170 RepID=A0ABY4XD92_9SPHN|nr:TonB-dependent receptor [Sphingomonas morindae]USI74888.1 TonB-dependent receptor [Sphingomonas morindae]